MRPNVNSQRKCVPDEPHLHEKAREAVVHDKVPVVVVVPLDDAVEKGRGFLAHNQLAGHSQDARSPVSAELNTRGKIDGTGKRCIIHGSLEMCSVVFMGYCKPTMTTLLDHSDGAQYFEYGLTVCDAKQNENISHTNFFKPGFCVQLSSISYKASQIIF